MNVSYALWLAVSGVMDLAIAWFGWKRRSASGAPALMVLMLAMACWSFGYALHWISASVTVRVFWLLTTYVGVVSAPVAFFVLVQNFIGRDGWLNRRAYILLSIVPALTLILLWTDPLHGLFLGSNFDPASHVIRSGGPWFYLFVAYSYGLLLVSTILLLRACLRSSRFYRRQAFVMLLGGLLPWLASILMLSGWLPLTDLDFTPIAFTGTGFILAYGFFSYRLMDLTAGRDMLVESMDEAVVVLDTEGRIVDINPKAMEGINLSPDLLLGRRVDKVFPRWTYFMERFPLLEGRVEHKLEYPPYSSIELRILALKDRQSRKIGTLITWRDISARKESEEKLRIFLQVVTQNPVAIVITDKDGYIEYVNPRFTGLTGYLPEEVRGRNPRFLQSGSTQRDTYAALWNTIKSGRLWAGELENRKKSGESYWAYEMIAPVIDEKGVVTHYVAMQQDVTVARRHQEELYEVNARLQTKLAEVEMLQVRLREEASHDSLTHLYNRRYMEEALEREVSRAGRDSRPISVVMMDVDLFKTINDRFGHQAGDSVVQTLGTLLLENTRSSDIACRYGGDEMLVVMPGATQEIAMARAEEWRTTFSMMKFTFGENLFNTTLSMGVATLPDQVENSIELLNAADKAMYWAKRQHNRVILYNPSTMKNGRYRSDDIR